jgi:hypothetical protein
MYAQEEATSGDVWALTALAGGLVAASCCLWYYSRRYVGEMALMMPDAERVRFSVLDFWGNREVRSARFRATLMCSQLHAACALLRGRRQQAATSALRTQSHWVFWVVTKAAGA